LFSLKIVGVGADKLLGVQRNFARILPNLPEKYLKKVTSKRKIKSFSCQFERHYFQIKACWVPFLLRFSGRFRRFSGIWPDFMGFCPDFHQIKFLGVLLNHRLLHHCLK